MRRALTRKTLKAQSFFDASKRPAKDVWNSMREKKWRGDAIEITGGEIHLALRDYLVTVQKNRCCYCGSVLLNGPHSKPLEHILPRVDFPRFSFHFWNLAVACSRCNGLKSAGGHTIDSGVVDYPLPKDFGKTFHPRFHAYSRHIKRTAHDTQTVGFAWFVGNTKQGRHLVETLLIRVSKKMALVANNPTLAAAIKTIEDKLDQKNGKLAVDRIVAFDEAFQKFLCDQANKL
ncbi:UNVERIFIED_ORG: hypothetical protein DFO49_5008 [Herbaspirillum seropedicae]